MKSTRKSKMMSLEDFTAVAWRGIRYRAAAAYSISWAVAVPIVYLLDLPFWIGQIMSGLWVGVVLYSGAEFADSQVAVWIDKVMVYDETMQKADEVASSIKVSRPNTVQYEMSEDGERISASLTLSKEQMREIASAYKHGGKLHRSDLTARVWPNLSRQWKDGDIQRKVMLMGLTDRGANFLSNPRTPESGRQGGTSSGVGGSDD